MMDNPENPAKLMTFYFCDTHEVVSRIAAATDFTYQYTTIYKKNL